MLFTKIEAVNRMLAAINEAPVTTLVDTGLTEVATAVKVLEEVLREVLDRGYKFNSDYDYELLTDVNGNIVVPPTALRMTASRRNSSTLDTVVRQGKLWDRVKKTFTFPAGTVLRFDIVWYLEFEDLPQAFAHYVTIRAARRFQRMILGDSDSERYTAEEELSALTSANDADCESGNGYNMIRDNADALSIVDRFYQFGVY